MTHVFKASIKKHKTLKQKGGDVCPFKIGDFISLINHPDDINGVKSIIPGDSDKECSEILIYNVNTGIETKIKSIYFKNYIRVDLPAATTAAPLGKNAAVLSVVPQSLAAPQSSETVVAPTTLPLEAPTIPTIPHVTTVVSPVYPLSHSQGAIRPTSSFIPKVDPFTPIQQYDLEILRRHNDSSIENDANTNIIIRVTRKPNI